MVATIDWLSELKYHYMCSDCATVVTTAETPYGCRCGGQFFLDRCADYLPHVVSDDMGMHGVVSPIDGKPYDSKSAYHRKIREAGCHVVEDGNVNKRQSGDYNVRKELTQATEIALSKLPTKRGKRK